MEILNSHFIALLTALLLAIVWVAMYVYTSSKRNRQWMVKSAFLGLPIIPALALLLIQNRIADYTLLPGNWSVIELGLVSGLFWAVASSGLMVVKSIRPATMPIKVGWPRVVGVFAACWIAILVANALSFSPVIVLIGLVGIVSLILAFQNQGLLIKSVLNGIAYLIITIALAYTYTYLTPMVAQYELFSLPVKIVIDSYTIVLIAIIAFAAPIISQWWFRQPLQSDASTKRKGDG